MISKNEAIVVVCHLRALIDAGTQRDPLADWLIRSKHNRHATAGEKPWDRPARSKPLGEVEFTLPAWLRQALYRRAIEWCLLTNRTAETAYR